MKIFLKLLIGAFVAVFLLLFALSCASMGDPAAGLTADGRLSSCPGSPNCVSSEEGDIEPLSFSRSPEPAWKNVRLTIDHLGGTVELEDGNYLAATFKSKIFRFVDDMEFRMIPDQKIIHIRSASRVGYSDMGVNRKRVERFREVFDLNRSFPNK
jgi:uncharacterized protein (DUF1499 family)